MSCDHDFGNGGRYITPCKRNDLCHLCGPIPKHRQDLHDKLPAWAEAEAARKGEPPR